MKRKIQRHHAPNVRHRAIAQPGKPGFRTFLIAFSLAAGAIVEGQIVIPPNAAPPPRKPTTPMQAPGPFAVPQPVEPAEIRDIRDPVSIPNPWKPWLIGACAIVTAIAIFFLLRALARKLSKPPELPVVSPYEKALEELRASRDYMKAGRDKEFSIAVSDAVRNFLEGQFNMPAPESTTEEFLTTIRDHALIKGPLAKSFSDFLQLCDLAKFARHPFGIAGMEELYANGENLIEETYTKHKMQTHVIGESLETNPVGQGARSPQF